MNRNCITPFRAAGFESAITIMPRDIDALGHVNNAVYLKWVQGAILQYWHQIAPIDAAAKLLWVALRHDVTYRKPLFLGDDVDAVVTARHAHGSCASFTTLIRRGDALAAEIQSSWCCVDAITRRPRRLATDLIRLFLPDDATNPNVTRP